MTRSLLLCVVVSACAGEAPSSDVSAQAGEAAIMGGAPSTGDDAVFMLYLRAENGLTSSCTATLIGERTLLTAAHCVDPLAFRSPTLEVRASNLAEQFDGAPPDVLSVVRTRLHPEWRPALGYEHDLGLVELAGAPQATPVGWYRGSLDAFSGQPVRAVGFGIDGSDGGMGLKRAVGLELRQVTEQHLIIGDLERAGICHGDSGGPTLWRPGPERAEVLVGVHSFTRDDRCVDGADARIDRGSSFIKQWLSEVEDVCGSDGVCATGNCATADPDCASLLSACSDVFDCRGRVCTDDPQHPQTYCSKGCASDVECPAAARCDESVCRYRQLPEVPLGGVCRPGQSFCLQGVCDGPPGEARCGRVCTASSECDPHERCELGAEGMQTCTSNPVVQVPRETGAFPAAPNGCAVVGAEPALLFALLLRRSYVLRRRRRV